MSVTHHWNILKQLNFGMEIGIQILVLYTKQENVGFFKNRVGAPDSYPLMYAYTSCMFAYNAKYMGVDGRVRFF